MPRDADGDRVAIDDRTLNAVVTLLAAQEKADKIRQQISVLHRELEVVAAQIELAENEVALALQLTLDRR